MKAEGGMLLRKFDEEITRQLMEKSVIPIGAQPPMGQPFPGWSVGISVYGSVIWGGSEENLISPGQKLDGFILTSYGLPGIRKFSVQSDYTPTEEDIFKKGISEEEYIVNTWEILDLFYKSITFYGKTIGPTAPPADFKPIEFLNYIINMKHEAFSLGWIKDKGIENSLNQKLENARKRLEAGDNNTARNILNALINEVEAQGCRTYENCPSGKHLTPEAYALLRYNVEYLINKL